MLPVLREDVGVAATNAEVVFCCRRPAETISEEAVRQREAKKSGKIEGQEEETSDQGKRTERNEGTDDGQDIPYSRYCVQSGDGAGAGDCHVPGI